MPDEMNIIEDDGKGLKIDEDNWSGDIEDKDQENEEEEQEDNEENNENNNEDDS